MALSISEKTNTMDEKLVYDDACGAMKNNTTGGPGKLYSLEVVAGANAVYVKLFDSISATIGVTPATMVVYVPANKTRSFVYPDGIQFTQGFSHCCVAAAAEDHTTLPTAKPEVYYMTS
jgi:hypothetical protein